MISAFEVAVMMRLDQMFAEFTVVKDELKALKEAQVTTTNFLADKKLVSRTTTDLDKKYQIKIPVSTYEDFQSFEQLLSTNQFFKKDVVRMNFVYA